MTKKIEPQPRPRGRPKGTGQGRTTRDYKVALPLDLVDAVEEQPNKSAFFVEAVRHYLKYLSRRR